MAESLAQQKKNMQDVLKRMTKKYGVVKLNKLGASLDLCVYLILREGWDFRKANRILNVWDEFFVDWNEIRVSYVRELKEALPFIKYADVEEKIGRVLGFLRELFNEYNRLNMDFHEDLEFDSTYRIFLTFESLGRANACIFLQCLRDELDGGEAGNSKTLVMSTDMLRVGVRLGLIKKTSSHNVGRKEYIKLVDPSRFMEMQNLFVRHGEQVCTSKSPACADCFLNSICKYYKP